MKDMSTIDILSPAGDKTGSLELPAEIFDAKVSVPLMHQVVVAQLAAARQGSTRAPQFAGGGVVHGPVPRDYSQRTPKKMIAAALRGALTDRARHNRIHVVTGVTATEAPSTKAAKGLFGKITERKNVLLVVERSDELGLKSARNLPNVHILDAGQLNTYDVLVSDDVVFTQAAFERFVAGPAASAKAVAAEGELEGSAA